MLHDTIIGIVFPILVSVSSFLIISKIQASKRNKIKSKSHHIFHRLKLTKDVNIKINLKLKSKGKENVFKSILIGQVDCILAEATDIVSDIESNITTTDNIQDRLTDALTHIFSSLYTFYENDASYCEDDKHTISIVMDKFYKVNKDRVDKLYKDILVLNNSIFYKTVDEKACVFFDLLIQVVLDQLTLAEYTFNTINGDLKGLPFKGEVIK